MKPNSITGIVISGKLCSGKGSFFSEFKKLVGSDKIISLAFADKLKIFGKYFLVQIANQKDNNLRIPAKRVAELMRQQLFNNEIDLNIIEEKLYILANQPHTLEYAKPGLKMFQDTNEFPEQDFGFDDLDKLLWIDCNKPRKFLQELGTECVRSIKDSAWIDYTLSIADRHPDCCGLVLDGRFLNEIEFCRERGFLDVRIEASEKTRLQRGKERDGQDYSAMLSHASENSLDDHQFSVYINNDGTIEEFREAIWSQLKDLIIELRQKFAVAQADTDLL